MGASHKAKLRLCVGIFPNNGVFALDSFKLCVVDDVFLRALRDLGFAKLLCFGGEVCDVIKSDSTVGGRCRTEVL